MKTLKVRDGYVEISGADSRTKNSKTFLCAFFPIDKVYRKELKAWLKWLRREKGFADHDPLFPKPAFPGVPFSGLWTDLSRNFYNCPGQPSRMISKSFHDAIGQRFGPHSIHRTIVKWVSENTKRQDQLKAASMNLGHAEIKTTVGTYLSLTEEQQIELDGMIGKKRR